VGVLSFLLFGLVAGAFARLVVPGRQSIGCLATMAVGVAGALLGGLIGQVALGHDVHYRWDFGPFLLSVVGAVILLVLLEFATGKRRFR
jgi:uncharacterized membrane protein YeaQ/YmgE (transglycosylase-associated protein family)